jgi:hypothetical protein
MAVFDALRRAPTAIRRNPILLVPMFVMMATQIPVVALQTVDPALASLFSFGFSGLYLFAIPFFQGGIIAMAHDSLEGHTTLGRFVDAGKHYYVSLLVAYLVLLVAYSVIGLVGVLMGLAGFTAVAAGGGLAGANPIVLLVFGAIVALLILTYLVAVFFLQFYGQAIVLEDTGAIDGLTRSMHVVRANLTSTLGYTLLTATVGILFGAVIAITSFFLSPSSAQIAGTPQPSLSVTLLLGVLLTLVGTLFGTFFLVFSVAFYEELTT